MEPALPKKGPVGHLVLLDGTWDVQQSIAEKNCWTQPFLFFEEPNVLRAMPSAQPRVYFFTNLRSSTSLRIGALFLVWPGRNLPVTGVHNNSLR